MYLSPPMNNLCQHLTWDSAFFGFSIARLNPTHLSDETARAALTWCEREGVRCLYFLADALDSETGRSAHQHGFQFVDIRLTLETKPSEKYSGLNPPIRPYAPDDLPLLEAIARKSYHDSRFYFDGRFPRERCDDMYALWVARDAAKHNLETDAIWVAADPHTDRAAGFITCQIHMDETGTRMGIIGLLGVSENAQGKGYGSSLISAAVAWFREQKVTHARVVTQGRNLAAQRAYSRGGFMPMQTEIWYHRWFD